jgi:translation initiation factor 1
MTRDHRGNSRLVYSSAAGRVCRSSGQPERGCRCGEPAAEAVPARPIARLRIETGGRGGKTVTVVFGLPKNEIFLKDLAQELKKTCGTGGAVRDDGVELQGDLRDRVRAHLIARGFQVKG